MPIGTFANNVALAGISIQSSTTRTDSGQVSHEVTLPAAEAGTLSTRTSDTAGMARTVLNADMGLATAVDSLKMLGLEVDQLKGRSPQEQFTMLADTVSKIKDPSTRAALAMQVFGKAGQKLIPMMAGGAAGGSSPILVGRNAISLPIASRFFKAGADKSIKNRRSEDRNPPTTSTEYTSLSIRLFLGRLLLSRSLPPLHRISVLCSHDPDWVNILLLAPALKNLVRSTEM